MWTEHYYERLVYEVSFKAAAFSEFWLAESFRQLCSHWLLRDHSVPSSTFVNVLRSSLNRPLVGPRSSAEGEVVLARPQLVAHREGISGFTWEASLSTMRWGRVVKADGEGRSSGAERRDKFNIFFITLLSRDAATLWSSRAREATPTSPEMLYYPPGPLKTLVLLRARLCWTQTREEGALYLISSSTPKGLIDHHAGPNHGFGVCGRDEWRL